MAHPLISTYPSGISDFDSVIDSEFGSYHSATSVAVLNDLYTSGLTLRDLRRVRRSPIQSASSFYGHKQIRRRPSLANLAGRDPEASPLPSVTSARHADVLNSGSLGTDHRSPSLLPPFEPWSRIQPTKYPSPSLTSSASSAPSSRSGSPSRRQTQVQRWTDEDESAHISTKRKFSPLRQAKRLPHRSNHGIGIGNGDGNGDGFGYTGLWEVHAAIIHPPFASTELDERIYDRSPHHYEGEDHVHRDRTSFSLAEYPFPAPAGHGYSEPIPPRSANSKTVMYRGTSFDVVNPHASLLSGHDLETPADIEQVLDHYFEQLTEEAAVRVDMPSPRTRVLYDDAAEARSNIMRHPSAAENASYSHPQSAVPRRQQRFSVRSDPFDLSLGDGEAGAATSGSAAVPENGTLNSIIGRYEYTQQSTADDEIDDNYMEDTPDSIERGLGIEGLTSPGTYGETDELLRIRPGPVVRSIGSQPTIVHPNQDDHTKPRIDAGTVENEGEIITKNKGKGPATTTATRSTSRAGASSSAIPAMWANVDVVSAPRGILTNMTTVREMLRSSSMYRAEDDAEWQTTRSNSREVRPSQEDFHFDFPLPARPAAPTPDSPRQGKFIASFSSTVSGVEPWSDRTPDSALLCQTRNAVADEIENRRQTLQTIDLMNNEIVSSDIGSPTTSGRRLSERQRKANKVALDEMRRSNPAAFRRASDFVIEEHRRHQARDSKPNASRQHTRSDQPDRPNSVRASLRRKLTPLKLKFRPSADCHRIMENSAERSTASSGDDVIRRRCSLDSTDIATGNFRFNESTNTFQTFRREPEATSPVTPTMPWDPTTSAAQNLSGLRPPPDMLRPRSAKELLPQFARQSQPRPRARSPQQQQPDPDAIFELRDLSHVRSNRNAVIRRGRLTDEELARREPNWSAEPNFHLDSPLARHAVRTPIEHLDLQNMRMLQNAEQFHNPERFERQIRISKRYLLIATPFPILLLVFGCGGFDWLMRRETKGRITEMADKHKKSALWVHLPLSTMVWGIVAVVVCYVVAVKRSQT